MRAPAPLLLLATLIAACGGSDPKALTNEGTAALNSGDAPKAVAAFDRALEHMDAKQPDYLRAAVGRCQALARIEPERAKVDFLALANDPAVKVAEADFTAVATELVRRGALPQATSLAEAGLKRFPESAAMKSLRDLVGDAAQKSKDPAALERLKGLGYAGDG